jgi:Xaa-Pro aminopeptidase
MGKIECIRKACEITDQIFKEIINNFNFKTEKNLADFIRGKVRKNKVKLAFPTIVSSGKNGAEIHHKPKNSKLKGFTVIDFGVKYKGYCSDMTRTVFVGKINEKQKKLYEKVKRVQENSLRRLKTGMSYKELDLTARKSFGKILRKKFRHALGHGVGSKVHQDPKISPKSKNFAKTGDIVTIEPGIYFKKRYGIRIEDTMLVKKRCAVALTKSSKELVVIS